jgi:hypothetical protein
MCGDVGSGLAFRSPPWRCKQQVSSQINPAAEKARWRPPCARCSMEPMADRILSSAMAMRASSRGWLLSRVACRHVTAPTSRGPSSTMRSNQTNVCIIFGRTVGKEDPMVRTSTATVIGREARAAFVMALSRLSLYAERLLLQPPQCVLQEGRSGLRRTQEAT